MSGFLRRLPEQANILEEMRRHLGQPWGYIPQKRINCLINKNLAELESALLIVVT